MSETPKRIKLSIHAAVAVQGAVNERNQLTNALRQKDAEIQRLTDLQLAEAGIDLEKYRCKGVALLAGDTYLAVEPIPEQAPPLQAPPTDLPPHPRPEGD